MVADLLASGFSATMYAYDAPYDVVVDYDGQFKRIQVKAQSHPRLQVDGHYAFNTMRGGQGEQKHDSQKQRPYLAGQLDLFALVNLETKRVAYVLPVVSADGESLQRKAYVTESQFIPFWQFMGLPAPSERHNEPKARGPKRGQIHLKLLEVVP